MTLPSTRTPLRAFPVAIALIFNVILGPLSPIMGGGLNQVMAAPESAVDEQGANDEPGQKDLTKLTIDYAGLPTSVDVTFNLDDTAWSGANTGDGCSLFDTDGDFNVNFSLCATVDGDPAEIVSTRLYACEQDAKVDRCTGPLELTKSAGTSCTAAIEADDPFDASAPNGPGDFFPDDAVVDCTILLSDVGAASAELVNVCSYPSREPNSDPSDCVLIIRDGFLTVVKVATPNDPAVTFSFTLDGVAFGSTSGSGQFTEAVETNVAHNLAEVTPTNWTLDSSSCNNGDAASAVEVDPGETVICTFNNSRQTGKLEVVKDLTPSDDPGLFNLQIDGTTLATNVGDGGTTTEQTLTTGLHNVGETAGTSTSLSNYTSAISCTADNGAGAVVASGSGAGPLSVSVTNGSDIVCTISNVRQTGKLEVVKDLTPDADPGLFDLQISGVTEADDVGDGGTTGEQTLNTGTYSVGEVAGSGTSLDDYASSITCKADDGAGATVASSSDAGPLNVSVTNGSDIVCTISNTRDTGKLEVVKDLSPSDDPGLFDLQIDGTTEADDVGDAGTTGEQTLTTGTYAVGEIAGSGTSLSNYTSSIECRDADGAGAVVASGSGAGPVNLAVGDDDDIVCVITNTRQTGELEVVKDLSPSDDPGLFDLQIDGATEADDVGDGGSTGEQALNTGTHTVGEVAGSGTTLDDYASSITCRADNGAGATVASSSDAGPLNVSVTNGSDIVCTISNTRETGTLEVVKDLNPSEDPGKFDLQINGATEADDVGDGGTTGSTTLNTGVHSVGELAGTGTDLSNYTSSIECRDDDGEGAVVASGSGAGPLNVTVGDDDDIVCVISNTRQTGTIEVIKDLNPSDDPGRFDLRIDGSTEADDVGDGGTTGAVTLNTGTHSVGEAAGTGTSLGNYSSSIECLDGETIVASGAGAGPLNVAVTHGADIVCTITNTRVTVGFDKSNDHEEDPLVEPGESIHYTLSVFVNNGTATNVVVTDELPAGLTYVADSADPSAGFSINGQELTWTVGTLAAGTYTFEYDATVDADASGSLTNLGCVDADQNDDLVCGQTTVDVQHISVEKTNGTTGTVVPGTAVDFTLTLDVTNGPIDDVTIVDQLPAGIDNATDISDGGIYDATANTITWELHDVADNETLTYEATVNATATAGTYTNVATITEGPCVGDCDDDSTVTVRVPTLVVDKAADTDTVELLFDAQGNLKSVTPESITWTLTWTLTDGPVTNAVITDEVPEFMTYVDGSASNGGVFDPATGTITWTFPTLSAGSGSVTFETTVDADAPEAVPLENVAVIDSDETAPDDGRDSITVTSQQEAGVTGTPKPSVPNTATVSAPNGQPVTIPVELLAVLFLASLGTLATANVRSVRRRR